MIYNVCAESVNCRRRLSRSPLGATGVVGGAMLQVLPRNRPIVGSRASNTSVRVLAARYVPTIHTPRARCESSGRSPDAQDPEPCNCWCQSYTQGNAVFSFTGKTISETLSLFSNRALHGRCEQRECCKPRVRDSDSATCFLDRGAMM